MAVFMRFYRFQQSQQVGSHAGIRFCDGLFQCIGGEAAAGEGPFQLRRNPPVHCIGIDLRLLNHSAFHLEGNLDAAPGEAVFPFKGKGKRSPAAPLPAAVMPVQGIHLSQIQGLLPHPVQGQTVDCGECLHHGSFQPLGGHLRIHTNS